MSILPSNVYGAEIIFAHQHFEWSVLRSTGVVLVFVMYKNKFNQNRAVVFTIGDSMFLAVTGDTEIILQVQCAINVLFLSQILYTYKIMCVKKGTVILLSLFQ